MAKSDFMKSIVEAAMKSEKKPKPSKPKNDVIDPRFLLIRKNYDLSALFKRCNSFKCKKKPSKDLSIKEINAKEDREKELALLYLCDKHARDSEGLQKKLAKMTKGADIAVSVTDRA